MKNLNIFIDALTKILGENLVSVIAFGSQANVDNPKNNLNLMIVTKQLSAKNLYDISKPVQNWVKQKNPIPVIVDNSEWYSSFDVYTIEYADMKDNYKIIYGADLVKDIYINKSHLRLQCEDELKTLLLKYKSKFLISLKSDCEMKKSLDVIIKTILVIFRSILRLYDKYVPYRAVDIIESVAQHITFNKYIFIKLAKVKYEKDKLTKKDLINIEFELINEVRSILQQIDKMPF